MTHHPRALTPAQIISVQALVAQGSTPDDALAAVLHPPRVRRRLSPRVYPVQVRAQVPTAFMTLVHGVVAFVVLWALLVAWFAL